MRYESIMNFNNAEKLGYWITTALYDTYDSRFVLPCLFMNNTRVDYPTIYNKEWFTSISANSNAVELIKNNNAIIEVGGLSVFDSYLRTMFYNYDLQPDIFEMICNYIGREEKGQTPNEYYIITKVIKGIINNVLTSNAGSYERIYSVLETDYKPLDNLNDTTIVTNSGTDKFTHGEKHTLSGTDTLKNTGTTQTEYSGTEATNSKDNNGSQTGTAESVYAFDSSSAVNKSNIVNTLETDKTDTLSFNNRKDVNTLNDTHATEYGRTDTASGSDTTEHGHVVKTTRTGKVDVTRYQDLMQAELELWKSEQTNFVRMVVRDCASGFLLI